MYATATRTYTITDIRIAFEHLEADLRALARRTGLRDQAWAVAITADVFAMASEGHLSRCHIQLYSADGVLERARTYSLDDGGSGDGGRSGGNNWPWSPGGLLTCVVSYSPAWSQLSPQQQSAFRNARRLSWGPSELSTSYSALSPTGQRQYVKNAARLNRQDYAR